MTTPGRMLSTGRETRAKIIRAAERLFAEHGITGVSLREINRVAGQANRSAVQYYFGDRDGLVRAILARHDAGDDARRHALLDEYEQSRAGEAADGDDRADDLRALTLAFVTPLVEKLADPDGGREYLRIMAEYYTRPVTFDEMFPKAHPDHSMTRWHHLVAQLLPGDKQTSLGTRFAVNRFAFYEVARRAAGPPRPDDALFASRLVDLLTAMLRSEPSRQTRRILDARRRTRPG